MQDSHRLPIHYRPLMIGCSGGGGHIAAINGIIGAQELQAKAEGSKFTFEPHILKDPSSREQSLRRGEIDVGLRVMDAPLLGTGLKTVLDYTPIPSLPSAVDVQIEVLALSKDKGKERKYVDMLLDVYPAGYESAAIWNLLQKADRVSDLQKLIALQPSSDLKNYSYVKTYFFEKLKAAAIEGKPYTELFSTQAMGLPALCDAVKEYNEWIAIDVNKPADDPSKEAIKIEALPLPIYIHQYMTDLATEGAVHFFQPLSLLTPEQQSQMILFGIKLDDASVRKNLPENHQFHGCVEIPPQSNPMVRPGFKDPQLQQYTDFDRGATLFCKQGPDHYPVAIAEGALVGSITLGSQAGADTFKYLLPFIEAGFDKVFVFAGNRPDPVIEGSLYDKLDKFIGAHPEYKDKVVVLANQDPQQMAPILTRSNVVVTRGGGLSVMEQMAMQHSPQQTILIHHADPHDPEQADLTSGISWEDENVNSLIEDLQQRGVHSEKTCPSRSPRSLQNAALIALLKRTISDSQELTGMAHYIQSLSSEKFAALWQAAPKDLSGKIKAHDNAFCRKVFKSTFSDNTVAQKRLTINLQKLDEKEALFEKKVRTGLLQSQLLSISKDASLEQIAATLQNLKKALPVQLHEDILTLNYILKLKSIILLENQGKSPSQIQNILHKEIRRFQSERVLERKKNPLQKLLSFFRERFYLITKIEKKKKLPKKLDGLASLRFDISQNKRTFDQMQKSNRVEEDLSSPEKKRARKTLR